MYIHLYHVVKYQGCNKIKQSLPCYIFLLPGCVTSRHDLVKGHCDMSVGLVPVYFINTWSHAVSITYGTF